MEIALIILSVVLAIISGFAKAIMDLSEEGKLKFYKKTFWLKDFSYQNKWKNGDKSQGEKFWQSSNLFVGLTDAWHLFGFIHRITGYSSFFIAGLLTAMNIWHAFTAMNYFVLIGTFHIFHTYKILKK